MERKEFFAQEIEIRGQKRRDARLLVWGKGQLVKQAEEVAKKEWDKEERKALDFV